MLSHLTISDMSCAACASAIEAALGRIDGVQAFQVSAATKQAQVQWDEQRTNSEIWLKAIEDLGYSPKLLQDIHAPSVTPEQETKQAIKQEAKQVPDQAHAHRRLIWQWGVAGICMMQVMMYAMPMYWADPAEVDADLAILMRYASLALSLPVLLFSCQPFFLQAWRDMRNRTISMDLPVAIAMFISFGLSAWITLVPVANTEGSSLSPLTQEVYFDSFTMFVFFLLSGRWIESSLRNKTLGTLDALMQALPNQVERLMADAATWETVSQRSLKVGDTIRARTGEAFPADGRVLDGHSWVEEALLTGESKPISKTVGDTVLAGSHNLGNLLVLSVTALGEQTRYAQITQIMQQAAFTKPRIAVLADRIARPFLLMVLILAAVALIWWWPNGPAHAWMVAVSVLVVTCPCALSLATPVAMLASTAKLAKDGILIRHTPVLERAAQVNEVFFDKTGTLTQDAFTLSTSKTSGIETRAGITPQTALGIAAGLSQYSLHPLSRAITVAQQRESALQKESFPPQSFTAVQEHVGLGVSGTDADTGIEYRLGKAEFCSHISSQTPHAQVHLSDAKGWLATFTFEEQIRPDAAATIGWLGTAGMTTHLVSGDRDNAVRRVAQTLGFAPDTVKSACSPEDKLAHIQAVQRKGGTIAMMGDGLNDGPVLAAADVSLAFGQASSLTQQHSDVVVLSGRTSAVATLIDQSRRTIQVVRQNLIWSLLYNLSCVPLAFLGFLPAWVASMGMALSSIAVIANAMRLLRPNPQLQPLLV